MSRAYYNEIDPYAAAWLRNLIDAGHIAPGDVDERSIEDVRPDDLNGYTQCHFFAGIGVWSYALRRAGWSDNSPVWTGSCPCQPFSAAGKAGGFADERHLWPAFFQLIAQCRPIRIFGEQVASRDGLAWLDLVQADLEGTGYAVGAVDLCAAGVGAPHIRQRLWFTASRLDNTGCEGLERHRFGFETKGGRFGTVRSITTASEFGGLADDDHNGRIASPVAGFQNAECDAQPRGGVGWMANSESGRRERDGCREQGIEEGEGERRHRLPIDGATGRLDNTISHGWDAGRNNHAEHDLFIADANGVAGRPGPTNGYWRDADWLFCRDGRWRPVEPGTFPLAHGATARVGRLRTYGNAINAEAAIQFIKATL